MYCHSNRNLGKNLWKLYIFGFNLPTKYKNIYDIRFILVLYSVHTVCQFLHDYMLIHRNCILN